MSDLASDIFNKNRIEVSNEAADSSVLRDGIYSQVKPEHEMEVLTIAGVLGIAL